MLMKFAIIDPIPESLFTPEDREIFEFHAINIQPVTGVADRCLLWSNNFNGYFIYVRGNDPQNIPPPSDIVQLTERLQKIVARSKRTVKYIRVVLTYDLDVFANACVHKNNVYVSLGGECYWITSRNIKMWSSHNWFQKNLGESKKFLEDQR